MALCFPWVRPTWPWCGSEGSPQIGSAGQGSGTWGTGAAWDSWLFCLTESRTIPLGHSFIFKCPGSSCQPEILWDLERSRTFVWGHIIHSAFAKWAPQQGFGSSLGQAAFYIVREGTPPSHSLHLLSLPCMHTYSKSIAHCPLFWLHR